MNSLSNLTERIQAVFVTMSPQFQQSARYVLDHADQVPLMSMRQLAAQAQVQPATLLRLPSLWALAVGRNSRLCSPRRCMDRVHGVMPIRPGRWYAIEIKKIACADADSTNGYSGAAARGE